MIVTYKTLRNRGVTACEIDALIRAGFLRWQTDTGPGSTICADGTRKLRTSRPPSSWPKDYRWMWRDKHGRQRYA